MAIQLFVPTFSIDECLSEIRECLEKGWTGLGFKTVEFEKAWCSYTGLSHAHFLNSATAGLDLAVRILKMTNKWNDGDEIISTPLTFVSTNHAVLYNNMKVVFADVDEYLCLDPKSVLKHITSKTRAVIFVGLGGNSGHLHEIEQICSEKRIDLIVDAAHMSGTRYIDGSLPGRNASAIVYSYQAVKNLPTADSGMICFKDASNDELVRKFAWLGINKDTYARSVNTNGGEEGGYKWKYDVEYLGYKDHGNSIMAAIGLVSLKHLDIHNAYRRQLAAWYDTGFRNAKKVRRVEVALDCESSRHLYQILVNNRDELMIALNEAEIFPGVHYYDNTRYKMYNYAFGTCPKAHKASDEILSLPMHIRMTKNDVHYIVEQVVKYSR
jgi:dTDP-4-amino-4,6-dideoxygalactose transaminase